jgi:peptide/nickel transport system ATP-binding protein
MGLLPRGQLTPVAGSIRLEGEEILQASARRLRQLRGDRMAMVFQEPMTALNPVLRCGEQIDEVLRIHTRLDAKEREARIRAVLDQVQLPELERIARSFPHQLSGGQRQRIMIAMALVLEPALLIADEPTTALDVTTQASVLGLFRDLQAERDMAVVFVTHDIGVVSEIADRVVVMYAGKVMERGPVETVLVDPAHPYTRALLDCLPGRAAATEGIGGEVPDPADPPSGCRFHPRCPHAIEVCTGGEQPELHGADDSRAACVFYRPGYDASRVRSSSAGPVEGNGGTEDGGRIGEGGDE